MNKNNKSKDNLNTKIMVTMGPQLRDDTKTIVGSMPASCLLPNNYEVPIYDHDKKIGYQRESTPSRVRKLKTDLEKNRVDLPTAVLLNLRNVSPEDVLVEKGNDKIFSFDLDGLGPFYVVDGQHRLKALHELIAEADKTKDDNKYKKWRNFLIPFVCMIGADIKKEMEEFHVVNSNAKSVKTDLALTLLKKKADADPNVRDALVERKEQWKVDGQEIVEQIANDSPVWKNLIRFPNQKNGNTIITSSGMVSSLKPLLKTTYFGQSMKVNNQVQILDAYWHGIKEIFPEAFDDPSSYSIQKGIGVLVLHAVLEYVLEYVRSENLSVISSTSYSKTMRDALENFTGPSTVDGDSAEGLDFWKVGGDGAIGAFSSEAGRRVLIERIRLELPKINIK